MPTQQNTHKRVPCVQPPPHAPRPVIYVFFTNPDEASRCSRARPFSHPRDKSEDGVRRTRPANGNKLGRVGVHRLPSAASDLHFLFRGDQVARADFINGSLNSISRVVRSLFSSLHTRADCNSIVTHARIKYA